MDEEEVMDSREAMKALAAIRMARDHAAAGRHGPATALLMQAVQEVPQLADDLEAELTFSLKAYGERLTGAGQDSNALWLYSQAIPLLPRPRGLYTNLGALQYSLGKAAAAVKSFEKALEQDPSYWPALESLENVKSLAVDRWHYRMLNHNARNESYSRAIERAVKTAASRPGRSSSAGVTVLDIGTGTGILAVMSARAGASHVFACEVNGVLCDVAKEVLERNGVADRVTVINKSSGSLEAGVDLPAGGVDVIVTELVDSGLLGERIIPVLVDARARGLLAEGGRVVPEGACVYAAVLESETIRRRSRLVPGSPVGLRTGQVSIAVEEPYTCEDLSRMEHRLLTSPAEVLEINFLEDGAMLAAPPPLVPPTAPPLAWLSNRKQPRRPSTLLTVERAGRADAIAVWFDLWLDGERGERDVVSTRPERRSPGDASGWDAGVYFASGIELHAGGDVVLEVSPGHDRLHLALNGVEGIPAASAIDVSMPTNSSERETTSISGCHVSGCTSVGADRASQVLVGEMDLARLNDQQFHRSYATAVAAVLAARGTLAAAAPPPRSLPASRGLQAQLPAPLPCSGDKRRSVPTFPRDSPLVAPTSASAAVDRASPGTTPSPIHADIGVSAVPAALASSTPPAYVLDLCGAWGMSGLLVAQLEMEDGRPATRVLALCGDGEEEAAAAMNTLARENGLGPDRYVASAVSLLEFASCGGGDQIADRLSGGLVAHSFEANATAVCCGRDRRNCCCWPRRCRVMNNTTGEGAGGSSKHDGLRWSIVMASSIVEGSGLLRQGALGDLELCRRFICGGGDGGGGGADGSSEKVDGNLAATFVPGSLEVVCQGLQRASLLSENRVLSSSASSSSRSSLSSKEKYCCRCCGVDVSPVNTFGVANFRELDLSAAAGGAAADSTGVRMIPSTARRAISRNKWSSGGHHGDEAAYRDRWKNVERVSSDATVRMNHQDDHEQGEQQETFLTDAVMSYKLQLDDVRAGLDGCTPRRSSRLRVELDGTLHAIAYWYRQRLVGSKAITTAAGPVGGESDAGSSAAVLDTGPAVIGGMQRDDGDDECCSRFHFSHFRQAAVLLDEPVVVRVGQAVDLSLFCTTSHGVLIQVLGIVDC